MILLFRFIILSLDDPKEGAGCLPPNPSPGSAASAAVRKLALVDKQRHAVKTQYNYQKKKSI